MASSSSPDRHKHLATHEIPQVAASVPELGAEPSRRIQAELGRHPDIGGFLAAGTQRLIAITDEQTAALGIEAIAVAKVRNATAVDAVDVVAADTKLNHPAFAEQVKAWLFGIGGVLIGAGLSLAPTLALTKQLEHPGIWWSGEGAVLVVGLILAGVGFPRRRR